MAFVDERRDAERGYLVADRVRIAGDLPDVVVQRLFSMALKLAGTVQLIDNEVVSRSVQDVMDELDATIGEIRTTIFAMRSAEHTAQRSS